MFRLCSFVGMPHRVTLEELERNIYIAIKVAPKHVKSKLRSKLALESDAAAREMAKAIIENLSITEAVGDDPLGNHSMS